MQQTFNVQQTQVVWGMNVLFTLTILYFTCKVSVASSTTSKYFCYIIWSELRPYSSRILYQVDIPLCNPGRLRARRDECARRYTQTYFFLCAEAGLLKNSLDFIVFQLAFLSVLFGFLCAADCAHPLSSLVVFFSDRLF